MDQFNAFPVLKPQTFKGVNLGALFVPAGMVNEAQAQRAAVLATPFQGPMHVHAVPVMFTQRNQRPAGTTTPGGVGNV